MTEKEINIAIAKWCGIASKDEWGSLYHTDHGWVRDCPDFCNDLNAMHEAEVWLKPSLWSTYHSHVVEYWNPTARQRAEAFLKTLNLWKQ